MRIVMMTFMLCLPWLSMAETESMAGPRIGVSYLTPKAADYYADEGIDVEPIVVHFGWQFETKFLSSDNGPEGVSTLVPMIGGFEQNLIVPSLNWILGIRLQNGYELGFGPNFSIASSGVTLVGGRSFQFGDLYLPINLGLVMSESGNRYSFLFGFNSSITR